MASSWPLVSSPSRFERSSVRGGVLLTEVPAAVSSGLGAAAGAGSGGAPPGGATSLEELEQQMDPTVELGRLVDEGALEEAFTKALGLSSVEMVTCGSKAEPTRESVWASPCPLSQGVLLSLMQQLSCDLEEEPQLKLAWIRDACLAVDLSDPMFSQHIRPILEAVFNGLHETATAPRHHPPSSLISGCASVSLPHHRVQIITNFGMIKIIKK